MIWKCISPRTVFLREFTALPRTWVGLQFQGCIRVMFPNPNVYTQVLLCIPPIFKTQKWKGHVHRGMPEVLRSIHSLVHGFSSFFLPQHMWQMAHYLQFTVEEVLNPREGGQFSNLNLNSSPLPKPSHRKATALCLLLFLTGAKAHLRLRHSVPS